MMWWVVVLLLLFVFAALDLVLKIAPEKKLTDPQRGAPPSPNSPNATVPQ
jgi:hypothetical protein